jgi:predicted DNA-binding transcriptional regulator YafY
LFEHVTSRLLKLREELYNNNLGGTMKKIDRLWGIISVIKENKKITAKEIAQIFEVSERTVYRDIDVLSQLKVPVISYEGFQGGYEIDDSFFVPSVAFNENEILYLLICLKLGEIIKVPNMKGDYESLKYKVLNILEEKSKNHYMEMLDRIIFSIDYINLGECKIDIKDMILRSFDEYRNLIIEYYRPRNNETVKTKITPYCLEFDNGGWYIGAYCHLSKMDRFFRLDRIKSIELSEDSYEQAFASRYFDEAYMKKDKVTVVMEMEKSLFETMKNDKIFLNADRLEYADRVKVRFSTDKINKAMEIATRNYQKVKIIEPQVLIDNLKEMCRGLLEKY